LYEAMGKGKRKTKSKRKAPPKRNNPHPKLCPISLQSLEEDNTISCQSCSITVLQKWIPSQAGIEGDKFTCTTCRKGVNSSGLSCSLCGLGDKLFWPTDEDTWVHASCAIWNPFVNVSADNETIMAGLAKLHENDPNMECSVTHTSVGVGNRCFQLNCNCAAHVEPAIRNGWAFKFFIPGASDPEASKLLPLSACPDHTSNLDTLDLEHYLLSISTHSGTPFDEEHQNQICGGEQIKEEPVEDNIKEEPTPINIKQETEPQEPTQAPSNEWACSSCTMVNPNDNLRCYICQQKKPRQAQIVADQAKLAREEKAWKWKAYTQKLKQEKKAKKEGFDEEKS